MARQEDGATAVEYAILAAGIAAFIAATVYVFGASVAGLFEAFLDAWPE